jgi:hypothetical protein
MFVGKDVAQALGYTNTRKAQQDHVDKEDKGDGVTIRDSIGRIQKAVLINESGLYSLILSSSCRSRKSWPPKPAARPSGSPSSNPLILQKTSNSLKKYLISLAEYKIICIFARNKRENTYLI